MKTPSALAVYGYCTPILHHGRCNEIFQDFMRTKLVWPDGPYGNTYNVSTRHYKDVRLPYPISEHYETNKFDSHVIYNWQKIALARRRNDSSILRFS